MRIWLQKAWSKNTIISGLLAIMVWAVICYLSIIGREVSPILAAAGGAVIAYFFKAKAVNGGD